MAEYQKGTCLVLMPIMKTSKNHTEQYWTKHFLNFIQPLIEENSELKAIRVKGLQKDNIKEIIRYLVASSVVVADLTDNDPNVYWELGIRQSFKYGTITIAEKHTILPFEISLYYNPNNHIELQEFQVKFKEVIKACIVHPQSPDSQVLETISGRGTLYEIIRREEAIRRLDAVISECNRNANIVNWIIERAKKNQKLRAQKNREPRLRGKIDYTLSRCRTPAVELLITSRYIDAKQALYLPAEEYLDKMNILNEKLNIWENKPNEIEKWVIRFRKNIQDTITHLLEKIQNTRKTMV